MRVFRLLRVKKQLEQKQVADYAMVPVRDARELLYRMLRGGFLTLQVRPSHVYRVLQALRLALPLHARSHAMGQR
jgi:hypothetical protein